MKKFMHRSEGFTLIELMIVILIIAILVAIAVPVYLNARKNAQRRTCQANLRTIDGSIQSYAAEMPDGDYPSSWATLTGTNAFKKIPQCPSAAGTYALVGNMPPAASCPNILDHTI